MRRFAFLQLLLVAAVALYGLIACGGSGHTDDNPTSRRGRLTLSITWPSSRAIPAETQSIRVTAKVLQPADGPEVANQVVQRPEGQSTSQIVLSDIPSVKVLISATAYASNDGTGDVIASGLKEVTVPEDNSVAANIELDGDVEPPVGCPFYMARMRAVSATSTVDIATVSGAYAASNGVFATIFMAGTGEAHSDSIFRVNAPGITGTFPIKLHFTAKIRDEEPSEAAHLGVVGFTSPAGNTVFAQFMDNPEGQTVTHTLNVQHNQTFKVFLDLTVNSSDNTGVTATGDLVFERPDGVNLEDIECE